MEKPDLGPAELVLITVELAKKWLEKNNINRPIVKSNVTKLAADILADRYFAGATFIAIATDGTLLNGQHTLLAIIEANTPVWLYVFKGIDKEAMDAIDTGKGRRPGPQTERLPAYGGGIGLAMGAAMNYLFRYCGVVAINTSFGIFQQTKMLRLDPRLKEAAILSIEARQKYSAAKRGHPQIQWPCWTAVSFIGGLVDGKVTAAFLEQLNYGHGLNSGDPADTLRLSIERWQKRDRPKIFWATIRALSKQLRGERLFVLREVGVMEIAGAERWKVRELLGIPATPAKALGHAA
jgi:hypothetical protein